MLNIEAVALTVTPSRSSSADVSERSSLRPVEGAGPFGGSLPPGVQGTLVHTRGRGTRNERTWDPRTGDFAVYLLSAVLTRCVPNR